jgi:hypothetical protein
MTPDQIAEAQKLTREWMEEHGKEGMINYSGVWSGNLG